MALLAALLVREVRGLVRDLTGEAGLAEGTAWLVGLSPPVIHFAGLIFTEIPAAFEGFQFTQGKMGSATLKFKVLTDGLVHMACTSRFGGGGNSGGGWKSEVTSEEQLEKNGWKRERGIELKDAQKDHVWWTFTRTCKSGEEFTFRTEKYISPMLLMK